MKTGLFILNRNYKCSKGAYITPRLSFSIFQFIFILNFRRKPQNLTPPISSDGGSSTSGQSPTSTHNGSPPPAVKRPSLDHDRYYGEPIMKKPRISHFRKDNNEINR